MPDIVGTRWDETGVLSITFEEDEYGDVVFIRSLFRELSAVLEDLGRSSGCSGILFRTGGPGGGVAAYPVAELLRMDQNEIRRFCFEAQDTIRLIEDIEVPTCCLMERRISGPSLELALACDLRIMSLETGTSIRFPELGMGIIPPLGGVFSMIGRIGLPRVLDLFESCEGLSPVQALDLGLVDHLARADVLEQAGALILGRDASGSNDDTVRESDSLASLLSRLWEDNRVKQLIRISMAQRRAKHSLGPGVREAFLGILEVIREGLSAGLEEGLMVAARNFTDLISSQMNRNLLSLAHKGARLRRWVKSASAGPQVHGRIVTVMGESRSAVEWGVRFASKGYAVRFISKDMPGFSRLMREIVAEDEDVTGNIYPSPHTRGLNSSGLVFISSKSDDIEGIGRLVGEAAAGTCSTVALAIDTESLPVLVSEIPLESKHRVYGVSRIDTDGGGGIIEVFLRDDVHVEGLPFLLSFLEKLDPLTIVIKESPAGICRRVLTVYLTEALKLLEEGAGILRIEESALSYGLTAGPFRTLDSIGLGDYLDTARFLKVRIGDRFGPPAVCDSLQAGGIEGRDGGRGFYVYADGPPWLDESISPGSGNLADSPRHDEMIQKRLLYSIMGEAIRILGEGVSPYPEVVDFALTSLGLFPYHLGGPLRHASLIGIPKLIRRFEKLHRSWGARFEPPEFLYEALGERGTSPFAVSERI